MEIGGSISNTRTVPRLNSGEPVQNNHQREPDKRPDKSYVYIYTAHVYGGRIVDTHA